MNINDRLRAHLKNQSQTMLPVGQGAEAAMAAGDKIRRNRQIGLMSLSVLVVAAAGMTAFSLRFPADTVEPELAEPSPIVESEAPAESGVEPGAVLPINDMDWEVVDSVVRSLDRTFAWDGTFYAVSTVPGTGATPNPVQGIYTSGDGISWSEEFVPDDIWISDVDHHEGTLYAIGTSPQTREADITGSVEAQVATTSDGGASWQKTGLPVVAHPPEDAGEILWRSVSTRIAAGSTGVVGVVTSRYGIDFAPYLPDGVLSSNTSVERMSDGLRVVDYSIASRVWERCYEDDVVDNEGDMPNTTVAPMAVGGSASEADPDCGDIQSGGVPAEAIVYQKSWSEIGLVPPVDEYSELFLSTDGVDFETVPSPFDGTEVIRLLATDDGFVALVSGVRPDQYGWQLWASEDGRVWEQLDVPGDPQRIRSIGAIGNRIVVVGYNAQMSEADRSEVSLLASADSGRTWDRLDVPNGVNNVEGEDIWASAIDIGPSGVALAISVDVMPDGPDTEQSSTSYARLMLSEDMVNWSEVDLGGLGVGPTRTHIFAIVADGDTYLASGSSMDEFERRRDFTLVGTRK